MAPALVAVVGRLGFNGWFNCIGAWRRGICYWRDLLVGLAVSVPRGEVKVVVGIY